MYSGLLPIFINQSELEELFHCEGNTVDISHISLIGYISTTTFSNGLINEIAKYKDICIGKRGAYWLNTWQAWANVISKLRGAILCLVLSGPLNYHRFILFIDGFSQHDKSRISNMLILHIKAHTVLVLSLPKWIGKLQLCMCLLYDCLHMLNSNKGKWKLKNEN